MTPPHLNLVCDFTGDASALYWTARDDGLRDRELEVETANDTTPEEWPSDPQGVLDALYSYGCRPVRMTNGLVRWRNAVNVPSGLLATAGRMKALLVPLLPEDDETREYTNKYEIREPKKAEAKPVKFMTPEEARAFADKYFGYVRKPVSRDSASAEWNARGAAFTNDSAIVTKAEKNTYAFRRDLEQARALLDTPEAAE